MNDSKHLSSFLWLLTLMLCSSCASAPDSAKSPTTPPKTEASVVEKHALDVPLKQLSTETHEVELYQLDSCQKHRLPQACQDLAETLTRNHRLTTTQAFIEASEIACDGGIADACAVLQREVEPRKAACRLDENVKPDGSPYGEEEQRAINSSHKGRNDANLKAALPELTYCVYRVNPGTDRFRGTLKIHFHIDSQGNGRVVKVSPEEEAARFRPCFDEVFPRHEFVPHAPLACIEFVNVLFIK